MDAWLEQFDSLITIMAKERVTVQGSWVDAEKNECGWIRTFDDDDPEAGEGRFYGSAEWEAAKEKTRAFVSNADVTAIEYR